MIVKIDSSHYREYYIDTEKRVVFSIDKKTGERHISKTDGKGHVRFNMPYWGHATIDHLIAFAKDEEYVPKKGYGGGMKPLEYVVNDNGKETIYQGTNAIAKAYGVSQCMVINTYNGKNTKLHRQGIKIWKKEPKA